MFIVAGVLAVMLVGLIGMPVLMYAFAATLLITTAVAVHRSIPRQEK
jgi:hypothetical protein